MYQRGKKISSTCKGGEKNKAKKIICGKRVGGDHLELPGKRRLVSKDDGNSSFSMVEVVCQPHQLP